MDGDGLFPGEREPERVPGHRDHAALPPRPINQRLDEYPPTAAAMDMGWLIRSLVALAIGGKRGRWIGSLFRIRRGVAAGSAEYDSDGAGRLGVARHVPVGDQGQGFPGRSSLPPRLLAIRKRGEGGQRIPVARGGVDAQGAPTSAGAQRLGRANTYRTAGYLVWRLWPAGTLHHPRGSARRSLRRL